jgi:hypothetical protein
VLGNSERTGRTRGAGCVDNGPFKELRFVSLDVPFAVVLEDEE